MVKHMIIWKMNDGIADKTAVALEGLVGKIDGLLSMSILTECYPCSAGDVMMDSSFESLAALEAYQKHPLHVEIANGLVRPAMSQRLSFDYEI